MPKHHPLPSAVPHLPPAVQLDVQTAMSGSMSVHSLIDKFSEDDAEKRPSEPQPRHNRSRLASPAKFASSQPPGSTSGSTPHLAPSLVPLPPATLPTPAFLRPQRGGPAWGLLAPPKLPISGSESQETSQGQVTLEQVLGPQFASIPLTEASLVEALRLRTEQERSRQEELRLELALRNLAIIQAAVQNDVPGHLIPSMCVGGSLEPLLALLARSQLPQAQQALLHVPQLLFQHLHPDFHHRRASDVPKSPYQAPEPSIPQGSGLGALPRIARGYDQDNASLVAPLNYRFGAGSSHRPLSPAKIGAAAVANLSNPITPYRPAKQTLPTHQRHFSMPAETLLAKDRPSERSGPRTRLLTKPSQLQLPLGATSSIQVRPSPAQPLHKQARTTQAPSQESMTSFQHVIQFHHWKPENPGQQPEGSPERQHSHKRHKSSDMSVDLGQKTLSFARHTPQPSMEAGSSVKRDDPDVSMDTSDVTITETTKRPDTETNSETSRSPSRHDVLPR